MKTLLIDFDGVLHSYTSGWKGDDVAVDPPVDGAILWLKQLVYDKRFKVCIYSSRSSSLRGIQTMKSWLMKHGMYMWEVDSIKFPTTKEPAWLTIDDRAIQFQGVFPPLEDIAGFKPWNR